MGPFGALCISLWKTGTPVLYLVVWGRGPTSPRGGTARPRRRFPVAKAVHSTLGCASRQCVALRWPWRRGPGSLSPAPPVSAGCPPAGTRAVSPGMPDSPALTFAKCSVLQSWPRPTSQNRHYCEVCAAYPCSLSPAPHPARQVAPGAQWEGARSRGRIELLEIVRNHSERYENKRKTKGKGLQSVRKRAIVMKTSGRSACFSQGCWPGSITVRFSALCYPAGGAGGATKTKHKT